MTFTRLYLRVLDMLGPEARLGWLLALANLALAVTTFAEPVLFGRIVDALSSAQAQGAPVSETVWQLLAAWVGFGLFTIACSAAVALHADGSRIAGARRC